VFESTASDLLRKKNMSAKIIHPFELIRKGCSMSRRQLAERAGVSQQFIFDVEKGQRKRHKVKLEKLKNTLSDIAVFNYFEFWREFRRIRKLENIRQKLCAEKLNVTPEQLSGAEHGHLKLCKAVSIAADFMDIDLSKFYVKPFKEMIKK
jgi:transcriptional regulator with XRE-family HTH domain